MNYRPICDVWILARSKVKYYGAYPAGFLHRARALMGVLPSDAVLHVCGGKVRDYPFRGLGVNDKTLDLDPACSPDYLRDAREPFPLPDGGFAPVQECGQVWAGVLIDRPYSKEDAKHYVPGPDVLPTSAQLLKNALAVVPVGGKVGILDYEWPAPPPGDVAREVAIVAVGTGRRNKARWFTVWERLK